MNRTILWDAGSTLCFITFKCAEELNLIGHPVKLDMVTVGGKRQMLNSKEYKIYVTDQDGIETEMNVLGIN